jgi:hypothetical protein
MLKNFRALHFANSYKEQVAFFGGGKNRVPLFEKHAFQNRRIPKI